MRKKFLFLMLLGNLGLAAQAQYKMIVEKTDGTTVEFNVADVNRIYFQNQYALQLSENELIANFISANNISVISEEQFLAQDSSTDLDRNEFVLFCESGIYVQIVNKGDGQIIEDGQTVTLLCRFQEYDIEDEKITRTNIYLPTVVDKMVCSRNNGSFTASFTEGIMVQESSVVPHGWLKPLEYLKPSRNSANISKVRLIVPHTSGTPSAAENVKPFYYEISYQLAR